MERSECLLHNKDFIDGLNQVHACLLEDYSKYLLNSCEDCFEGFSKEDARELHYKLGEIYSDIVYIRKILKEYQKD